jgi:serine protease Do
VTKGVISAKDRVIDETLSSSGRQLGVSISGAIQTDAAINPGNSGGPLLNLRGEVVGINTAGLFGGQGQPVQGIFFAVSAQVAEPVVKLLVDNGKVDRGYMGVSVTSINRQLAQARGLNVNEGAGIERVESNSPAEKAGLRPGDIIIKIGDTSVKNVGDVTNALTKAQPGQKVRVEYVRDGKNSSTEVTLTDRPTGVS